MLLELLVTKKNEVHGCWTRLRCRLPLGTGGGAHGLKKKSLISSPRENAPARSPFLPVRDPADATAAAERRKEGKVAIKKRKQRRAQARLQRGGRDGEQNGGRSRHDPKGKAGATALVCQNRDGRP